MAKIIAKTIEGKEFMYSRTASYSVSKAGANEICKAMNENRYQLKAGEKWHVYDVGDWELDYMSAGYQQLMRRKGSVYVKRSARAAL